MYGWLIKLSGNEGKRNKRQCLKPIGKSSDWGIWAALWEFICSHRSSQGWHSRFLIELQAHLTCNSEVISFLGAFLGHFGEVSLHPNPARQFPYIQIKEVYINIILK